MTSRRSVIVPLMLDARDKDSSLRCLAEKTQLLHPGQYVKVTKHLPLALQLDFMAIGDKQGIQIKKKLEKVTVTQGSWGDPKKVRGQSVCNCCVQGFFLSVFCRDI